MPYPTPYGSAAINNQNCSIGAIYNEMTGSFPAAGSGISMEWLVQEGNRLRPDQITEASRPHDLGQFLNKFQLHTCDLFYTGPSVDIYRDTVLIQNDFGGTEEMVYYDYDQNPQYDVVLKHTDGSSFINAEDYNAKIYSRAFDQPLGAWTLDTEIAAYTSQSLQIGDGLVPDPSQYKSFRIELTQIKRYGRLYGESNAFIQQITLSTDGTYNTQPGQTSLLKTSTVWGFQNVSVGSTANGYQVIFYTRAKQTSGAWNQFVSYASYAGESVAIDFQSFDCKVFINDSL